MSTGSVVEIRYHSTLAPAGKHDGAPKDWSELPVTEVLGAVSVIARLHTSPAVTPVISVISSAVAGKRRIVVLERVGLVSAAVSQKKRSPAGASTSRSPPPVPTGPTQP